MKKTFNPKKPLTIAKVCLAHGSKTVDLSESLLADVAGSYDPAVYAAPLVKGHPTMDDPRFGTVSALNFNENQLLASTQTVDAEFVDDVNGGSYPYISMSVWEPTHKGNPMPGHWYLKHVGFLGAVAPAIKGQQPAVFELADGNQEDGVVTFAFDTYSESWIARLFRNLREHIIDKDGTEVADRIVPDYAIEQLAEDAQRSAAADADSSLNPEFSEPNLLIKEGHAVDPQKAAALESENAQLKQQLADRTTTDAKRASDAQHASHIQFCDGLVSNGQLVPAHKDLAVAVLDTLQEGENATVTFGEGDGSPSLYDAYKTTLGDAQSVEFAEFAGAGNASLARGGNEQCPLMADALSRHKK